MIEQSVWEGVFDANNPQTKEYFDLCSVQTDSEIFERHHILPKGIFPEFKNCQWNIVKLAHEQHHSAHRLLQFICLSDKTKLQMTRAFWLMTHTRGIALSEDEFKDLRIRYAATLAGKPKSDDHKRKLSEANKGHIPTDETCRKLSIANKGRKHTEESKEKMSDAQKGEKNHRFGKTMSDENKLIVSKYASRPKSDETKAKMALAATGRKHTEETKKKLSEIALARLSQKENL